MTRKYLGLRAFMVAASTLLGGPLSLATTEAKLKSGAPLLLETDATSPRETVVITFPGGPGLIPSEVQGLAIVLKELLNEGPMGMSGDAFRDRQFMGSGEIIFSPTRLAFNVIVKAPADRLKDMLALVEQIVAKPKLDEETFNRAKEKVLTQTAASFDNMRNVVLYYGFRDATQNHPYVLDGSGSPRSVGNITLDKVKELFPAIFNGKTAFFSAVGPVEQAAVASAVEQSLGTSATFGSYAPFKPVPASPDQFKKKTLIVKIIDKPGATDNQILFFYPEQVQMDNEEAAIADVAHAVLGGGLTGRLGKTLRTERGLTYHAGTFVTSMGWGVYTFGGKDQTPKLLTGVPEVIKAFKKEELKEREIGEAKEEKSTEFKTNVELPVDRLTTKLSLLLRGLNPTYVDKYHVYLGATNKQKVKDFVSKKVKTDGGYLYLMGDGKKLSKALKDAGIDQKAVTVISASEIL